MSKKVYTETVKKWAVKTGIPGGVSAGVIFLIFLYLATTGSVNITGYSGDYQCAGTEEDPCYAYLNFTANEDIFIYPVNYDPWGRTTIFSFKPGIESWKLERSWGTGWRELPLNKGCTGTWCGGKKNAKTNVYSVAFREGRTYKIRVVGYKRDPMDSVKWGFSDLDPTWLSYESIPKPEILCYNVSQGNKHLDLVTENCYNITYYNVTVDNPYWVNESYNATCWHWVCKCRLGINWTDKCCKDKCNVGYSCGNSSDMYNCTKWHEVEYHNYTQELRNHTTFLYGEQYINIQGKSFKPADDQLYCTQKQAGKINCDSTWDGNGDGVCNLGESCLLYEVNGTNVDYVAKDHWKKSYEKEMKDYNVTEKNSLVVSG